jgi:hypothetical protein
MVISVGAWAAAGMVKRHTTAASIRTAAVAVHCNLHIRNEPVISGKGYSIGKKMACGVLNVEGHQARDRRMP